MIICWHVIFYLHLVSACALASRVTVVSVTPISNSTRQYVLKYGDSECVGALARGQYSCACGETTGWGFPRLCVIAMAIHDGKLNPDMLASHSNLKHYQVPREGPIEHNK